MKDNRQQNAERRLRHATWEIEPRVPLWEAALMILTAAFIGALLAVGGF